MYIWLWNVRILSYPSVCSYDHFLITKRCEANSSRFHLLSKFHATIKCSFHKDHLRGPARGVETIPLTVVLYLTPCACNSETHYDVITCNRNPPIATGFPSQCPVIRSLVFFGLGPKKFNEQQSCQWFEELWRSYDIIMFLWTRILTMVFSYLNMKLVVW